VISGRFASQGKPIEKGVSGINIQPDTTKTAITAPYVQSQTSQITAIAVSIKGPTNHKSNEEIS
jgi:hypothetical protein